MTTKEIANTLEISEHHLSKVLQRLTKIGLLKAGRGPNGGFGLNKKAEEIPLLRIYEEFEGPLSDNSCLLAPSVCPHKNCPLAALLSSLTGQIKGWLERTTISDLKEVRLGKEKEA